jgi:hypothetical protein
MFRLLRFCRWTLALVGFCVFLTALLLLFSTTLQSNFSHLLKESASTALSETSHTALGFLLFWVVVPSIVWISVFVYKWRTNKKAGVGTPLKSAFLDSTKPLEMIPLAVIAGVWLVILGVFLGKSIYSIHHDEVGRWAAVVNEKNQMKRELAQRDRYIKNLEGKTCPVCPKRTIAVAPTSPAPLPSMARTLTESQAKILRDGLRAGIGLKVRINAIGKSRDTIDFANELREMFKGWELSGTNIQITNIGISSELEFAIPQPQASSVQLAVRVFDRAHIAYTKNVDPHPYRGPAGLGAPPELTINVSDR